MKNENLIHVRLNYEEAIRSRKNILYIEKSLMIFASAMEKYSSLRGDELDMKIKLHRKVKELITGIRRIQKSVPNVKFSEMPPKKETKKPVVKAKKHDGNIMSQLREIQEKLNSLQ